MRRSKSSGRSSPDDDERQARRLSRWDRMGAEDRRCGVMLHQNPWHLVGGAEALAWASGWHRAQGDLNGLHARITRSENRNSEMTQAPPRPRTLRIVLSEAAYVRLQVLHARYGLASNDLVLVLLEKLDVVAQSAALDRALRDRAAASKRR